MSAYLWNTFCPTLFGTGATQEVGIKAKELGMSKVMVVTEQALMDFKVATQVTEVLEKAWMYLCLQNARQMHRAQSAMKELRSTEKKEQMALWQ